jgi:hypothetical protein
MNQFYTPFFRYILNIIKNGWNDNIKAIFFGSLSLLLKFLRKLHVIYDFKTLNIIKNEFYVNLGYESLYKK